ncbi:MAG: flavodoxin family protein [Lachnospiraceae bacterium]|nr:flavodoxin family protein [Lachnospiraceae bacterium]
MKALLVNGSPHEHGCTYTALNHVAKALREEGVEPQIYWIGNSSIHGCMDCGKCAELRCCVLQDKVNEFREIAKNFDGYIFGTPVYYAGMNGSMKAFMDRLFFSDLWGQRNTFTMKPAASVITARRAGTTAAYDQINKYFAHNQMPIISSTYWNLAYGMKPDQIEKDAEGIYTMENLGRNMAYFLKCVDAGKRQGVPLPSQMRPQPVRQSAG